LGEKIWRRLTLEDRGSRESSVARNGVRSAAYFPLAFLFTLHNVPIISHIGALPQKAVREAVGNGTARAGQAKDLYDILEPLSNAFDAISQLEQNISVDEKAKVAFFELFRTEFGTDSFTTNFDTLSKHLFMTLKKPESFFQPTGDKEWLTVYPFIGAEGMNGAREICQAEDIKAFRENLLSHFKNNFLTYKENVIEEASNIYNSRILKSGFGYGPSKKLKPLAETAISEMTKYDIEYFADKEMSAISVMNKTLSTSRLLKMTGK
jgi:hypothetical protein